MAQQNHVTPKIKIIGYVSLVITTIVLVGLFFVNYLNGIALIEGIIIYFLLISIIKGLSKTREYFKNLSKIRRLSFLISQIILCGILILLWSQMMFMIIPSCGGIYYRVIVTPKTPQLDNFKIQEYVIFKNSPFLHPPADWIKVNINNQTGYQLPERIAIIENRGFLLKEVVIRPPMFCNGYYDSNASVELNDFPLNSFYAAHYAQELQKFPYLDTETVTWNSDNLEVKFGYVYPPFQILQPLLKPFVGVSTLSQWVIGIIGLVGSIVFVPIIKPLLTDRVQKALKNMIERTEKTPKPTAKLIVSDKGDEKEFEIRKSKK